MIENWFLRLTGVLLLTLAVGCGANDVEWSSNSPKSHGFDPERLEEFDERLDELSSDAVIVARDGDIVLESYSGWRGSSRESIASIPKAVIGSLLLAAAVENGAVGFDDAVWRYVPHWKLDPQRAAATLRHLAAHSSGLEDVFYVIGDDLSGEEAWRRTYQEKLDQRFELAIRRTPLLFTPGERTSYSGNGYYVLSAALSRSLAGSDDADLNDLYTRRVTRPLGIPDEAWTMSYDRSYDYDGLQMYAIGSGAEFTARAVARIGELMLGRGSWDGQQLFEARTMEELLRAPGGAAPAGELGVDHPRSAIGWYLNTDGFFPSLPRDAIIGAGGGHRILLVVPSLKLVFVRLGRSFADPFSNNAQAPYWKEVEENFFAPLMATLVPEES